MSDPPDEEPSKDRPRAVSEKRPFSFTPPASMEEWVYPIAWEITLAAILTLSYVGRPLQFWLRSRDLLHIFVPAMLAALFLWLFAWLVREATRLPVARLVIAGPAAAALLAWGLTFPVRIEATHLFTFGLFGFLSVRVLGLWRALPVVAVFACANELLQYYLPSRVGDWADVRLNVIAGAVGLLIAWATLGRKRD